jgi:uncharacterized membrane protein YqaE (UPF0057 family)
MRKITIVSTLAIIAIIAASCGSSNNVVNKHLISKRKYTKGFHINKKSHLKTDKESEENIAYEEAVKTEKKEKAVSKRVLKNKETENYTSNLVVLTEEKMQENNNASPRSQDESNPLTGLDSNPDDMTERTSGPTRGSQESAMREMSESEQNQRNRTEDAGSSALDGTALTIILVILALIIPPLAVFIFEGATSRFWIDLILAILGYGLGFGLFVAFGGGIWWLLGLAAVIYALLIVLSVI